VEVAGPSDAGTFRLDLTKHLQDGLNEWVLTAKSPTFERERRLSIAVHAHPVELKLVPIEASDHAYDAVFGVKPGLIDLSTAKLTVHIIDAKGKAHPVEVKAPDANGWRVRVQGRTAGPVQIKGLVHAKSIRGQDLAIETETVPLGEAPHAADHEHTPAADQAQPASEAADPVASNGAPAAVNWARTATIVGAGNVLLGAVAYALYVLMRRRLAKNFGTIQGL
jgi:hypothetical protein